MRWLNGITDSMDMSLSELWEMVGGLACCDSWGRKESDMTEATWQQQEQICSGCSLEGLMLKLKLQYFGHLM